MLIEVLLTSRSLQQLLVEILIVPKLLLVAIELLSHLILVLVVNVIETHLVLTLVLHIHHPVELLLIQLLVVLLFHVKGLLVVTHLNCCLHQIGVVQKQHLRIHVQVVVVQIIHRLVAQSHLLELVHLIDVVHSNIVGLNH